jgi:hypothetical protein
MRTTENDNDVSKKYFRDPSTIIQQQKVAVLQKSDQDSDDGNALIQKLRQQSVDNREKNDLYVARKTFEADQVCVFMNWWFSLIYICNFLKKSSHSYLTFSLGLRWNSGI